MVQVMLRKGLVMTLSNIVIEQCREKLLIKKAEILNRIRAERSAHNELDFKGDETDLAVSNLAEHQFLTAQSRMRELLLEIEVALSRIEQGRFGLCEETEEPIETERLLAIPWTRLSIEGAEIREDLSKRFMRS